MLLPGAIYVAAFILVIVAIAFSVALGSLGGAISFKVSDLIIRRTETWKNLRTGRRMPTPWWAVQNHWFFTGWVISSLITLYCATGPFFTILKWLGGN